MSNIDFILRCLDYEHVGDKKLMEHIIISIAVQNELQTQGIQIKLCGSSGKGKTDAVRAILKLVGKDHYIESMMSDKAVFYANEIKEGQIIFCDDKKLSPELEGIVKRAASNFQEPYMHKTLTAQNYPVTKIMPSRILWFFTSVSNDESDELLSRCVTSAIDESDLQDDMVSKFIKNKAKNHKGDNYISETELKRCNEIFNDIKSKYFIVHVPYADKIDVIGRRDLKMFIDHLRGYAILDYENRDKYTEKAIINKKVSIPVLTEDGNPKTRKDKSIVYEDIIKECEVEAIVLDSNDEDYLRAKKLYGVYNSIVLTDVEKLILSKIPRGDVDNGTTIEKLQRDTNMSRNQIFRFLHGRKDRNVKGLLDKIEYLQTQEIGITKKVLNSDGEDETRNVRVNIYYRTDKETIVMNNKEYEQSRLNIIKNANIE